MLRNRVDARWHGDVGKFGKQWVLECCKLLFSRTRVQALRGSLPTVACTCLARQIGAPLCAACTCYRRIHVCQMRHCAS